MHCDDATPAGGNDDDATMQAYSYGGLSGPQVPQTRLAVVTRCDGELDMLNVVRTSRRHMRKGETLRTRARVARTRSKITARRSSTIGYPGANRASYGDHLGTAAHHPASGEQLLL